MKKGCLIGTDKYGNRYYENPYYFYGRNRWVEYADHFHMNYDGSQIPAEWFGWMHYKVIISLSKEKVINYYMKKVAVIDGFTPNS